MRGLVQRVEVEPAAREGEVACRFDEPREHCAKLALQRVGLRALPVLERRRVAQAEALEQLAAELGDGRRELTRGGEGPEAVDVDLEPRAPDEADAIARCLQR